jgi:hypothetical protein
MHLDLLSLAIRRYHWHALVVFPEQTQIISHLDIRTKPPLRNLRFLHPLNLLCGSAE